MSRMCPELFVQRVGPVPGEVQVLTRRNRVRPASHTWSVHPQQGNHTSSGSNSISMSRWDLNFHTLGGLACYTVRSHGKSSFNIASGTFVGFQGRHDDF